MTSKQGQQPNFTRNTNSINHRNLTPVRTLVGGTNITLTADESGTTFLCDQATAGTNIYLPAASDAAGCTYTFIMNDTDGLGFVKVWIAGSDLLHGVCLVDAAAFSIGSKTVVRLAPDALLGDYFTVVSNGSTSWYVRGQGFQAASITVG